MSTTRDLWLETRPVIRTRKINKTLTIPAFSARCGESNHSLFFPYLEPVTSFNLGVSTIDSYSLASAFTIEMWIKPIGVVTGSTKTLIAFQTINNDVHLFINSSGKLSCTVYKAAAPTTIASTNLLATSSWQHVAAVFTGSKLYLYINGIQDANSGTVVAPLDASVFLYNPVGSTYGISNQFQGYVDEIRCWNIARTDQEISFSMFRPVGSTVTGLKRYYKFNEAASAGGAVNKVDGHVANIGGQYYIVDTDHFPLAYGASFAAFVDTIVVDAPCSLQFPVVSQSGANHGLLVSWLDEDTGLTQRRKLYEPRVGILDIAPDYATYNGEKLPTTFHLEFWNVDGNEFVTLDSDLVIPISITSQPTTGVDHTSLVAAVPSGTSDLAASFPWTFPVSFNQPITYP